MAPQRLQPPTAPHVRRTRLVPLPVRFALFWDSAQADDTLGPGLQGDLCLAAVDVHSRTMPP
jgi:hypothetical protein